MCDYVLTRGKNKGKCCGNLISKSCKEHTKCRNHINKTNTQNKQCEYVGPKNHKRCTLNTPSKEYKYCAKHQGVVNRADERRTNKLSKNETCELKKIHKTKYENMAAQMFMDLFTLNETQKTSIDYYTQDSILTRDGREIKGPCKALSLSEKIQCIISPMGTGKTEQMRIFTKLNLNLKILIISSRISLGDDLYSNVKKMCPSFKHYKEKNIEMDKCDHLVVQSESLHRLTLSYDIIIVDECTSLRLQMQSVQTHKLNININQQIFYYQMLRAQKIVLMDAIIHKHVLDYYEQFIVQDPKHNMFIEQYGVCGTLFDHTQLKINVHKNEYVNSDKPKVSLYVGDLDMYCDKIIKDLDKNVNVVVVVNSKNKGHKIENYITKKLPDLNYVYYNSEYPFPSHVKEDGTIFNVNDDFIKYQLVMYSPTIQQGVDFNIPHFGKMYAYYTNRSNSLTEFVQQLGRIRVLTKNKINVFAKIVHFDKEIGIIDDQVPTYPTYKELTLDHIKQEYSKRVNITDNYLKSYLDNDTFMAAKNNYFEVCYNFTGPFKTHFLIIEHEKQLSKISGVSGLISILKFCNFNVGNGTNILKPKLLTTEENQQILLCEAEAAKKYAQERINYFDELKIINHNKYSKIKETIQDGLVNLELQKISKFPHHNPQQIKAEMEKTLHKKRLYQLVVLNHHINSNNQDERDFILEGKLYSRISGDFMFRLMANEHANITCVKNALFEKAVLKFMKLNNVGFNTLLSSLIFDEINCTKFTSMHIKMKNFQINYLLLKTFKKHGIDTNQEFSIDIFNAKNLNLWDDIETIAKFVYKYSTTDNTFSKDIKWLNSMLSKWKNDKIVTRRTSDKFHKNIYFCRIENYIEGFDEYIANCDVTTIYNDICIKFNKNIYSSEHIKAIKSHKEHTKELIDELTCKGILHFDIKAELASLYE